MSVSGGVSVRQGACVRQQRARQLSLCFILSWLLLSFSDLLAEDVTFTASVDRVRTTKSQPIQLTLTIASAQNMAHVPAPDVELADFEVYGPAVSTQVEFVNGAANFTRSLTYSLYPLRTGKFTIQSARLDLDGRQYETKALAVEVVKRDKKSDAGAVGNGTETIEDYLSLRATAGRQRAFVGQQVTLAYDLLYRVQVQDVSFKSIPSFSGFWFKTLFVARQLDPKREMVGDIAFNATPLRTVALFPTTAGRHRVEAFEIACSVQQRGRRGRRSLLDAFSLFDDPAFGRSQTLILRSEEVDVEVLPLPENGQPAAFYGAVGDYTISVSARPRSVPVGDPVTVVLEIAGTGNIGAVTMPLLPELDGFEAYEPKRSLVEELTGNQYGGKAAFEYILIPQHGGQLEIPSVSFAYFDPETGEYETRLSERISVDSYGDSPQEEQVSYGLTRAEIAAVGEDIRHIKPDAEGFAQATVFHQSSFYWALHIMAPLGYGAFYFLHRHRRRLVGDVAYARRRRAKQVARRRLTEAERELEDANSGVVCARIQEAILGFVADQSNRPVAGLTTESCLELAGSWGAADVAVAELSEVLRLCEFRRYAPGASDVSELRQLHGRAGQLIADLGELRE